MYLMSQCGDSGSRSQIIRHLLNSKRCWSDRAHACALHCSLTFLSPRKFGLVIPAPIAELRELRRLKLLRIASKQFAPLLLPPGFAGLAATLSELVLESADWPAIPQVPTQPHSSQTPPTLACMHSSGLGCHNHWGEKCSHQIAAAHM